MKTIYSRIVVLFAFSLALWSCEKDEDKIVIQPGTKALLTSSQSNLVLREEDADKDALTFNWTAPDFGYSAAITYSLEFGTKDSNFENAVVREYGNSMFKTLKVGELNNIANQLGMTGFEEGEMEVRVKADVGGNYEPTYSDIAAIILTPYLSEPPYATLYLVGAATEGAWNENAATPMFRNAEDPFVFTYTGFLKADDFKILGQPGKWAPSWGMGATADGKTALTFRGSLTDQDTPNFSALIPSDGYYTVTVSLRTNTLTIAPYDVAGKQTYNSIGVVGQFNGWNPPDALLTNTSANPHYWSGMLTLATVSELKFRVNQDWGTNWGTSTEVTGLYGKGGAGAANLKIAAGTYRVIFNDLTENYVFIKQ